MHVLLLNQFFYPDVSAVAQLATDLAEDLVTLGFTVTAIAARGTYLGRERLAARQEHRGVRIIRVQTTSLGKGSSPARMADYGSFLSGAFARLATLDQKPDVVVAMCTPPFVGIIAAAMRAVRGIPFVYWAHDLYPDIAVELEVLSRESVTTRILEQLSSYMLRRADGIITLGNAMARRLLRRGARSDRMHVVPNWADPEAVRPLQHAANAFRSSHALDTTRVVAYSGNMGRAHDLETIIGATELFRHRSDLTFLFIGDGAKRDFIARAATTNPHIRLLPYQERGLLSQSLSAADLHFVTQAANTEGLVEPSKLYGVMAAGRPTLFIGPAGSEAARTILDENIGEVVANGDIFGVSRAIDALLERGPSVGQRAREALESKYGRKHRTAQIAQILSSVVSACQGRSITTAVRPSRQVHGGNRPFDG